MAWFLFGYKITMKAVEYSVSLTYCVTTGYSLAQFWFTGLRAEQAPKTTAFTVIKV